MKYFFDNTKVDRSKKNFLQKKKLKPKQLINYKICNKLILFKVK